MSFVTCIPDFALGDLVIRAIGIIIFACGMIIEFSTQKSNFHCRLNTYAIKGMLMNV